jgi:uncharacterized protein YceK
MLNRTHPMRAFLFAVITIGAAVAVTHLSGCATIAKLATPAAAPFVNAGITFAVFKEVGTNPATQVARAQKIQSIAEKILAADNGVTSTVAMVQTDIIVQIAKLNLPPADTIAAQELAMAIGMALNAYVTNATTEGAVAATTQVIIADVANTVIAATKNYTHA